MFTVHILMKEDFKGMAKMFLILQYLWTDNAFLECYFENSR